MYLCCVEFEYDVIVIVVDVLFVVYEFECNHVCVETRDTFLVIGIFVFEELSEQQTICLGISTIPIHLLRQIE